MKWLTQYI
jgi:hypothetical protein